MKRYDVAIIGTGPAGLEAALTLKARNKEILLLGDGMLSGKIRNTHMINNYLGLPNISGEEMKNAFLKSLNSVNVSITEDKVNVVYSLGKYFMIQGHKENYEANSLILATGIDTVKSFPGEKENLGRGISYCATCDGAFYRDREVIVVSYSKEDVGEIKFLADIAKKVTVIKMFTEDISLQMDNIEIIGMSKINGIEKTEEKFSLIIGDEADKIIADGIFILREKVAVANLVPGIKMNDGVIEVNRKMETNIAGCFACGDLTGAPYQYIKAAGEGNVAGISAVEYLSKAGL